MIRLGLFVTNQYPNSGIRWYNQGTIVFKGNVAIGANSAITLLRKDSYVEFGANFGNVTSLRLNCDYRIIFKENVRIGWDVSIMDSSMHRLKILTVNLLVRVMMKYILVQIPGLDPNVWFFKGLVCLIIPWSLPIAL